MTSFSRMHISLAVYASASRIESALDVVQYFEKSGLLQPKSYENLFVFFDTRAGSKVMQPMMLNDN